MSLGLNPRDNPLLYTDNRTFLLFWQGQLAFVILPVALLYAAKEKKKEKEIKRTLRLSVLFANLPESDWRLEYIFLFFPVSQAVQQAQPRMFSARVTHLSLRAIYKRPGYAFSLIAG